MTYLPPPTLTDPCNDSKCLQGGVCHLVASRGVETGRFRPGLWLTLATSAVTASCSRHRGARGRRQVASMQGLSSRDETTTARACSSMRSALRLLCRAQTDPAAVHSRLHDGPPSPPAARQERRALEGPSGVVALGQRLCRPAAPSPPASPSS